MTGADPKAVAESLREMPAWAAVGVGDSEGLQAVEAAVEDLCGDIDDVDDVVAGIRRFVEAERESEGGFGVSAMSKVYVVARYCFDVPEFVPANEPGFGAFVGVPVEGDRVNELWPWETDEGDDLHLTGFFRGYSGESYQAVPEVEAFERRYGPRE
jgi:hypothetical protein